MYKVTLSGMQKDAKEALDEQTKKLIEEKNMTEEQRDNIGKFIDLLPEGSRLSGTIEDHNNGTVIINVTSRHDFAPTAAAIAESRSTDTRTIPGAGAVGGNPKAPQQPPGPDKK